MTEQLESDSAKCLRYDETLGTSGPNTVLCEGC